MNDDQYKLGSYEDFDALSYEFGELVKKGQLGPWYFCDVEHLGDWDDENYLISLSALGFKITKWIVDNKKENDKIIYLSEGPYLTFNSETLIKKFKRWYKKQDITEYDDTELWSNVDDFYHQIQETGKIHLEQKIYVKDLLERYNHSVLTEHIFDIYCWMEDNLGEVYCWDHSFYFVSEKDAVAFKLRWIE